MGVEMSDTDAQNHGAIQFEAEVKAFANGINATALLVVVAGDYDVRSWYFGQRAHAKRIGANGACCAYAAYAKAADAEADACDKQADAIPGDDEVSARAKRSLKHEANRLRRIAVEHRDIANDIDASHTKAGDE